MCCLWRKYITSTALILAGKEEKMLEELKNEVYRANMALVQYGLVIFTWGNVSGIDRKQGLVVIKPSGVDYERLTPEDMVVLDLEGNKVEGRLKPSSDTPTHLELYRAFETIGGVTHTHSMYATSFAQSGRDILPLGTTHADYFDGSIPCTRQMSSAEIGGEYEKETGKVIIETLQNRRLTAERMHAALVHSHGPFTWGKNAMASVEAAVVLENVAHMAFNTDLLYGASAKQTSAPPMQEELLRKHFDRKHGKNAYYGQN